MRWFLATKECSLASEGCLNKMMRVALKVLVGNIPNIDVKSYRWHMWILIPFTFIVLSGYVPSSQNAFLYLGRAGYILD